MSDWTYEEFIKKHKTMAELDGTTSNIKNEHIIKMLWGYKNYKIEKLQAEIASLKNGEEYLGKMYHIQEYSINKFSKENKKLKECLVSISKNSCCDKCQEAKMWADKCLREINEG